MQFCLPFGFFISTACLLPVSFGWSRFEKPLEMAQPNSDGIYDFDLLIEHKLTMATRRNGHIELVDFVPSEGQWNIRDENGTLEMAQAEQWPDLLQMDGKHHRVVTLNGHSPGKVLVVPFGAKVAMRVRNRLPSQALTIHLHGMHKMRAWWTDGVAFVQQCPIQPGQDFIYRFIADTPGTHWFHGHLMNDRADGLLGGFVVKHQEEEDNAVALDMDGQKESVPIGREYFAILQDWSSTPSSEQWLCHISTTMKWLHGFDAPGTENGPNPKCWAPKRTYDSSNVGGSVPLSAILFGEKGWHSQKDIRQRPSQLPLSTLAIKAGENLRLRLVNGGVSQGIMLWVEGHEVWVLAADGVDVEPRRIDALIIFPGERYDVLIRGIQKPLKRRFWLQLETMEYIDWDWTILGQPQVGLAKLEYEDFHGVKDEEDIGKDEVDWSHSRCTLDHKCLILNCPFAQFPAKFNWTCVPSHLLESAKPMDDPELLEQKQFVGNGTFHEIFANMHSDNHFDGWMFSMPMGIPYYNQPQLARVAAPCDAAKCNVDKSAHWEKACQCFVHFTFALGAIVQITVYNMGDMAGYSHPLHIHGTHFALLKVGYGTYHAENGSFASMNEDLPCRDPNSSRCVGLQWANASWLGGNVPDMQRRPSLRDTVNVPVGGYVTIRFRAINPGWWFAHCHLMLHNMGGMAFAFRVGTHEQVPKPPESYPHSCGIYEEPAEVER